MAIGKEPGDSTMIRVSIEVRNQLEKMKVIPREATGDVVKRLIKENQEYHKIYGTTQTRPRMERDIKNFVLNPTVPDTTEKSRNIWLAAHPGETLTQDDHIHHINGNHDDNRIENLQKVTYAEHAKLTAELNKEFMDEV